MPLPLHTADEIELELAKIPGAELVRAARELSENYRGPRSSSGRLISTDAHRAAYLAVRFPATYAAVENTLIRLRECAPDFAPQSVLDLGAGPGTATLATYEAFPSLTSATLVERDSAMLAMARRMLAPHVCQSIAQDLASVNLPRADLVICAYTLNELSPNQRESLLERASAAAKQAFIIVEPGSPDGFANVLAARQMLIAAEDWNIAAPCPGEMPCPLDEIGDWCHFAARVQRTGLHRRLKDAALSYEDEKFSYVIGVKQPLAIQPAKARILRRPEKLKGHVNLQLCTIDGLQSAVITKKHGSDYKRARNAQWGDAWE